MRRSWATEGPLRLLMNNLDPDVAERPEELIVYGGIGRAARNWEAFDRIVSVLKTLEEDQTLLVQSGKPVGVFPTHPGAPRVIIANANLVPNWSTWEHFNELDRKGLMMYGQMTAGSWIYIGSQGIVQGTYETFSEIGRRHFGGLLAGRWFLTAGLGGMGGAQPLAATMAGASILVVECQPSRIEFRKRTGFLESQQREPRRGTRDDRCGQAKRQAGFGRADRQRGRGLSRDRRPRRGARRGHRPDLGARPDQRLSADRLERRGMDRAPRARSQGHRRGRQASMAEQVRAILAFRAKGAITVDYGNNIRAMAQEMGVADAFAYPGFVEAYVRPLFCIGKGPFRWVALSGDPDDIYRTDDKVRELIPDDPSLNTWLDKARAHVRFQGLPSRICWLGLGQRHRVGLAFNEMVANGEVSAPIVIGRDHMDSGSVASPMRETEGMLDGSDAVSDWPILNALLNSACGATWVSFHHGGGVGIGYSQHAGMALVADGTPAAAEKIARVLWNDPATGIMRHADAGYELAQECARRHGVWLPMLG